MYKKSSSDTGGGRKKFNSAGKDNSRGGDSGRKPFNRQPREGSEGGEETRGRKPFGKDDREGGSRPPRRTDSRNETPGKRPFRDDRDGAPRKKFGEERETRSERPFRERDDRNKGDRDSAPRRKFDNDTREGRPSRPFREREDGERDSAPRKKFGGDRDSSSDRPKKSFRDRDSDKRDERPAFKRRNDDDRKPTRSNDRDDKPRRNAGDSERPSYRRREEGNDRGERNEKPFAKRPARGNDRGGSFPGMPDRKKSREDFKRESYVDDAPVKRNNVRERDAEADAEYYGDDAEWSLSKDKRKKRPETASYPMPLNKYIAHSGECSRRDAAELVRQGKAKVNGELITDPGHKVNATDKITLSGKKLTPQKGLVYILLNKPKGFITTNEDEKGRKTVMDLIGNAGVGRVFSIGRLDRATTGLLLLTNDGALAQKLSHPSYNTKKVYHVTLDKPFTQADFEKVLAGVELEDGKAEVDEMAYLEKKNELGLEIHSGKNRIVRRIFESLGYVVEKLDRMMYAGLTKKNLPRGKWRFLDEREIVLLKHFKS
jgi:23S rRNA pseudouridine2605 synthase